MPLYIFDLRNITIGCFVPCDHRDIKPASRDFFSSHETLMYSSLSASTFNSLMLSTDSPALSMVTAAAAAAVRAGLPVDLASVLSQLAATQAKQGIYEK